MDNTRARGSFPRARLPACPTIREQTFGSTCSACTSNAPVGQPRVPSLREGQEFGATPLRLGIVGVGNCASLPCPRAHLLPRRPRQRAGPRLMHVDLGGYHVGDVEVASASTWTPARSAATWQRRCSRARTTTIRFADPQARACASSGHDLGRLGRYLKDVVPESGRAGRGRHPRPQGQPHRRPGVLLAGGLAEGGGVVRGTRARSRLRLRQLHACLHRVQARMGRALPRQGLPIIGDDIKSQVGATTSTAC